MSDPVEFTPAKGLEDQLAAMNEKLAGMPAPEMALASPVAAQEYQARANLYVVAVEATTASLVRSAEALRAGNGGAEKKRWVMDRVLKYAKLAEAHFDLVPDSMQPAVEALADELVERVFREQVAAGFVNRGKP